MGNILDDLFGDIDLSGLTDDIKDLLGKIPKDDPDWGAYSNQLHKCLGYLSDGGATSLVVGGKCLRDLYNSIKDKVDRQDAAKAQVTTIVKEEMAILPIALAAAAGVGAALLLS